MIDLETMIEALRLAWIARLSHWERKTGKLSLTIISVDMEVLAFF